MPEGIGQPMRTSLLLCAAVTLSLLALGCGGGGSGTTTPGSGGFPAIPSSPSSPGGPSGPSGPGAPSGVATDTQPPAFTNVRLFPIAFDFAGGTLTISADVIDASPVLQVTATVQRAGAEPVSVPLNRTSGSSWQGTWTVPANQSTTGQRQTYTVSLRAQDAAGNLSPAISAGSLSVAAPDSGDSLPPPPVWPNL
jgi:hypothetical protein